MSKSVKIGLGVLVVVVLAGIGGWYFLLREDAAKPASLAAIDTGAPAGSSVPAAATPDGSWKVQKDTRAEVPDLEKSVFGGYRILELFAGGAAKKEATGHSPEVSGTMVVKGNEITAAEVTVDTTKLKSSEPRRDAQVANRGLETTKFPTATFKLTSPITLPSAPVKDQEISVTAKGDLTLHGVTKSVEIPLKASWNGSQIKVATAGEGLPIVLADYNIEPINVPGFVEIDNNGKLELQLLFVPA